MQHGGTLPCISHAMRCAKRSIRARHYFGHNPTARHPMLARQLFASAKAPLLRAHFRRTADDWRLETLQAISAADVRPQPRAANLIGSSLYGVDLKQVGTKCYLIEVNDNPNVDAGNEDQVLGNALYREVMGTFARRIAERGRMLSTG